MIDSKRLAVKKRFQQLLEGVTPANGYNFDLTGSVFRDREAIASETSLPAVSMIESYDPDRAPQDASDKLTREFEIVLLVQGWVDDGPDGELSDPADILMADVKKRIASVINSGTPHARNPDHLFGGLVTSIRVEPGVVRPPDQSSARAYFFLRVFIGMVEHLEDPYKLD